MKTAIAQYPVIADIEIAPRQKPVAQSRPLSRAEVTAYVAKAVIAVAALGMTYGCLAYGRIFENYLQW